MIATRLIGIAATLLIAACSAPDRYSAAGSPEQRAPPPPPPADSRAAPAVDPHADAEHDRVEPGLLERPIGVREGIGAVHLEVTAPAADAATAAEAQRYFDQGLALLHDFVWIDAARCFHETLRRAPECPMAWVGLSRAQSGLGDAKAARAALEKARIGAARATPREQRFVELRALQLDAMEASGDKQKELHAQYKSALEQAVAAYEDGQGGEVELVMLRANAEEPSPGGIGQMAERGSIAWYQRAADRVPDHVGAHHGLSHAWENAGDYAKALAAGERFRELAPAVPHAWHMCGHDLPRLGRWNDALAQFERAEAMHAQEAEAEHLRVGDDWHRAHNLLLLSYTRLRLAFTHELDVEVALATFRQQFETPIRGGRPRYTHAALAEALLALQRDDEALAVTRKLQEHVQPPATRSAGAALEGEILVAHGDVAAARRKLEQCDAALADDDAAEGRMNAPKTPNRGVRVHRTMLAAMIDLHGTPEDAARGEQALLSLADDLAGSTKFDAWGEGLFRLERAQRTARALGRDDLAAKLGERIARIDPQLAREVAALE